MIHEFAVNPDALASWQDFRFLVSQFGIPQGRLISRFPRKWKRIVYEATGACSTIDKKRIEEKLKGIDDKLLVAERGYDPNRDWSSNAEKSHTKKPFRAIITTAEKCEGAEHLDVEAISDEDEAWKVATSAAVPRTAADLASSARSLLCCSAEVVFVDQYFSGAAKYGKPLAQLIRCACDGRKLKRLEYHLSVRGTEEHFSSKMEQQCHHLNLPPECRIIFVRWKPMDGGENLHPRYILTERGGLHYDYGLDEGGEGETTNVQLLSEELHRQRWQQFLPDSGVFELVDAWEMTSDGVKQVEWVDGAFTEKA